VKTTGPRSFDFALLGTSATVIRLAAADVAEPGARVVVRVGNGAAAFEGEDSAGSSLVELSVDLVLREEAPC
jgi:hypothetical protein